MVRQKSGLQICQFGNPILRKPTQCLNLKQIVEKEVQQLIADMISTLRERKLGVGLAAPQVGKNLAIALINIEPTPLRKQVEPFYRVIINPRIINKKGIKRPLWEGCISSGEGQTGLFAQVPRFNSVQIEYYNENGVPKTEWLKGLAAHVAQHEIDHLNGRLFVDLVIDSTTFMTYSEYKKRRHELQAQNNYPC